MHILKFNILTYLAAVVLSFASPTGQAWAHAHLQSAAPAPNTMAMPAPSELRLKFSEELEPKFAKIKVTRPGQTTVKTGSPQLDPNDKTLLIVPLPSPLPDGKYTVDWQVVSTDGHKTKGSYSFTSMH